MSRLGSSKIFIDSSLRELGWINKDVVIEVEIDELQIIDAEKPYHLEFHHKYYLETKLPWQYPDDTLVTLCNWCHQEIHDITMVCPEPWRRSYGIHAL